MNLPDDESDIEKLGKIAALVILSAALIMISTMLYHIFTVPERPPHALSDYRKAKIERYCMAKGVRPEIIEIEANGRMTYMMDGKRCEIKG